MFNILDKYIAKNIFNAIVMTLFILISISGITKFIEQLRKIGQESYSLLGVSICAILNIPKDIIFFFPMSALLGSLLGLGALANNNELTAMQISGFSRWQISYSALKIIIPFMLLIISINEWIVPISEQIIYNYRSQMIFNHSTLSTKKNELWTKDGNDFIYIENILNKNKLFGVNIFHFNKNEKKLLSLRYATMAIYTDGKWKLSQIHESNITDNKKVINRYISHDIWKTNLTPNNYEIIMLDPNYLSISSLYNHIKYLKLIGQKFNRYQLNMWNKIFSPISISAILLIALSFIFGPLQKATIGMQIITGVSFGFLFYIIDQIFGPLFLVYNISPILGAILPSIIFLLISILISLKY